MDDEQVDANAVSCRQGGSHAEQLSVTLAAPGELQIDLLEVGIDAIEELACFSLIDFEAPLGRLLEQLQARRDRQAAGDLSRGHPSHTVSDDHGIGIIAHHVGQLFVRHVGDKNVLLTAYMGDQEMVFIMRPDLARMRDRAEFDANMGRRRLRLVLVKRLTEKSKTGTPPSRARNGLFMFFASVGGPAGLVFKNCFFWLQRVSRR